MEGNVRCLFKKLAIKDEKPKDEIAVILENGSIYNNMQAHFFNRNEDIKAQSKF